MRKFCASLTKTWAHFNLCTYPQQPPPAHLSPHAGRHGMSVAPSHGMRIQGTGVQQGRVSELTKKRLAADSKVRTVQKVWDGGLATFAWVPLLLYWIACSFTHSKKRKLGDKVLTQRVSFVNLYCVVQCCVHNGIFYCTCAAASNVHTVVSEVQVIVKVCTHSVSAFQGYLGVLLCCYGQQQQQQQQP